MEWISVKDRLPNFEESILFTNGGWICAGQYNEKTGNVYFHLSNTNVIQIMNSEINTETCGFLCEWNPWGNIDTEDVTHWMPLPEPPKE